MRFVSAAILALATDVLANNYTFYCGDSCTTGTQISTGANYTGVDCTNLETAQAYCYMVSDEQQYKAIVSKDTECLGTNDLEQVIWPGECYEGPWESYQVVANL